MSSTTYNKHLFLIIYNRENKILVLHKNNWTPWEFPSVTVPKLSSNLDTIEKFLSEELFLLQYKIKSSSSVINRYELPKEFQTITGFAGEEQRFEFIEAHSDINISEKYFDKLWINFEQLSSQIKMKNFENFKHKLYEDYRKILNENSNTNTTENKQDENIFNDINLDKLF